MGDHGVRTTQHARVEVVFVVLHIVHVIASHVAAVVGGELRLPAVVGGSQGHGCVPGLGHNHGRGVGVGVPNGGAGLLVGDGD